jgi:hypothetical protein
MRTISTYRKKWAPFHIACNRLVTTSIVDLEEQRYTRPTVGAHSPLKSRIVLIIVRAAINGDRRLSETN